MGTDSFILIAAFVIELSLCVFLARQVRRGNAQLWSPPLGTAGVCLLFFCGLAALGLFDFRATGERKHLFALAIFAMGFAPFLVMTVLSLGVSRISKYPRRIPLRMGLGAAFVLGVASLAYWAK